MEAQPQSCFDANGEFRSADDILRFRTELQWTAIKRAIDEHASDRNFEIRNIQLMPLNAQRLRDSGLFEEFKDDQAYLYLRWRPVAVQSTKLFVDARQLREYAQQLGHLVFASGWRPDFLVGVWRGGCPVALYIHEYLKLMGWTTVDHIAVRTSLYEGVDRPGGEVRVHGEQYLVERLRPDSRVLFCDDILESGRSMQAIYATLRRKLGDRAPPLENFRLACVFTKSEKFQAGNPEPHWFIKDVPRDCWVNFPHELEELSEEELRHTLSPAIYRLVQEDRAASLLNQ
jgi:hypoxanthine phosphoribosyltransferase